MVFCVMAKVHGGATILPIDSSSVNVKHSGKDFAYSIHENHGIALDPSTVHVVQPHQVPVGTSGGHVGYVGGLIGQPKYHIGQDEAKVEKHVVDDINKGVHVKTMVVPKIAEVSSASGIVSIPGYNYVPITYQYPFTYYQGVQGVQYPYNVIRTV